MPGSCSPPASRHPASRRRSPPRGPPGSSRSLTGSRPSPPPSGRRSAPGPETGAPASILPVRPLEPPDLPDPPTVTAAVERRRQPCRDDSPSERDGDLVGPQNQDVGIVVAPGELRFPDGGDQGGPDADRFVRADGHPDPGFADEDRPVGLPPAYRRGGREAVIGVIDGLPRIRPQVPGHDSFPRKVAEKIRLHGHSPVVRGKDDPWRLPAGGHPSILSRASA